MVPGIGSQKKLCLISIIRQTNAMESKTAWIRLFYIVFVVVSFTIATGNGLFILTRTFYLVPDAKTKPEKIHTTYKLNNLHTVTAHFTR